VPRRTGAVRLGASAHKLGREVVTQQGDLPVADAEDLYKRDRRGPGRPIQNGVDLGNEHAGVGGGVQQVAGLAGVGRLPGVNAGRSPAGSSVLLYTVAPGTYQT